MNNNMFAEPARYTQQANMKNTLLANLARCSQQDNVRAFQCIPFEILQGAEWKKGMGIMKDRKKNMCGGAHGKKMGGGAGLHELFFFGSAMPQDPKGSSPKPVRYTHQVNAIQIIPSTREVHWKMLSKSEIHENVLWDDMKCTV